MADHAPLLTSENYATLLTSRISGRLDDISKNFDPAYTSGTNIPTNTIRWNSALNRDEKWNGTSWVEKSVNYAINISGAAATCTGNAGTVTNGVYTTGTYVNPSWVTTLDGAKITGTLPSSVVTYLANGVGAVPRSVQNKLREHVSVEDMGAIGDGITDNSAAFALAFSALKPNGVLEFGGGTYLSSGFNVSGKAAVLYGYGSTIHSTGANGGVYKTDHGNKLIVEGLGFTGIGAGINQTATVQNSSQDELDIISCNFNMNTGVYGVVLNGGRNPRIQNSFFRNTSSGNGVYLKNTVSPFIQNCIFKGAGYVGRAVYYPGTGNGTDAGLILRDCEVLGWDKGLEVVGCDWMVVDGCTIDYNNWSIKLGNQDRATIVNNYIGSLADNPALWIGYDASGVMPSRSEKIIVNGNIFTGHAVVGNNYDCILVDGVNSPDNVIISDNNITFYTRYGVNFSLVSTRLNISTNSFAERTGFGLSPIYNTLGATDSGVVINNNYFANAATVADMNLTTQCRINENLGCVTEARGEGVSGTGVSTFTITHGLSYTPTKTDIQLTPTNNEAATKNPFISAVDATNITVGFTSATAAAAGVGWRVRRGR